MSSHSGESDLDADLLDLVDDKPRSKKPSKKRRKMAATVSDSDAEFESEDDVGREGGKAEAARDENPYPLEGKYKDEEDRERLLEMGEFEREEILASRSEELQRIRDSSNISKLLASANNDQAENVSSAAKRQHTAVGASKEKSRKLNELKRKREAKDKKERRHHDDDSPAKRLRGSSDSEADSEEGEIDKVEEEEMDEKADQAITIRDVSRVQLSRTQLIEYMHTPWYEDFVKGAFLRYCVGERDGAPEYRLCEVIGLGEDLVKPYIVDNAKPDMFTDQVLVLRHGKDDRKMKIHNVSNSQVMEREFNRFMLQAQADRIKTPSRRALQKVQDKLEEFKARPWTDEVITEKMRKKKALIAQAKGRGTASGRLSSIVQERANLLTERELAVKRRDRAAVARLDLRLDELNQESAELKPMSSPNLDAQDRLAKLNERNRRANQEEVRRAEQRAAERKKQMQKEGSFDPSARLKTTVRTRESRTNTPTPGTSVPGSPVIVLDGADDTTSTLGANGTATAPASPLPTNGSSSTPARPATKPGSRFEEMIVNSIDVEVDLGDF